MKWFSRRIFRLVHFSRSIFSSTTTATVYDVILNRFFFCIVSVFSFPVEWIVVLSWRTLSLHPIHHDFHVHLFCGFCFSLTIFFLFHFVIFSHSWTLTHTSALFCLSNRSSQVTVLRFDRNRFTVCFCFGSFELLCGIFFSLCKHENHLVLMWIIKTKKQDYNLIKSFKVLSILLLIQTYDLNFFVESLLSFFHVICVLCSLLVLVQFCFPEIFSVFVCSDYRNWSPIVNKLFTINRIASVFIYWWLYQIIQ